MPDPMLLAALFAGAALLVLPVAAAVLARRSLHFRWSTVAVGALAFVASQAVHIPLLLKLPPSPSWPLWQTCAYLGVAAAGCETAARYVAHRALGTRGFAAGVGVGLGHGGIESALLGVLVLLSVLASWPLAVPGTVGPALVAAAPTPWLQALLPVAERAMAITLHVALSLLVQQAVRFGGLRWVALAFALHALCDGLAVYFLVTGGVLAAEAVVGLFCILSVAIIQGFATSGDDDAA